MLIIISCHRLVAYIILYSRQCLKHLVTVHKVDIVRLIISLIISLIINLIISLIISPTISLLYKVGTIQIIIYKYRLVFLLLHYITKMQMYLLYYVSD